jgi:hypothetical protein
MIKISHIKTWAELAQATLTSLALMAGGVWTYYNYVHKRERFPRAEVQISAASFMGAGWIYLSTRICIKNIGQLLLPVSAVTARVQQVAPATDDYTPRYHPNDDGVVFDWPTLAEKEKRFERGELELEPNEIHHFDFDFKLPADAQIVKITAFAPNMRKAKRLIGWLATSIYSIQK